MDLFPTPTTTLIDWTIILVQSLNRVSEKLPIASNGAIFTNSSCTPCRAAFNFYCYPNRIAKRRFGLSCLFGVSGTICSGNAVATSFMGVAPTGLLGTFGA